MAAGLLAVTAAAGLLERAGELERIDRVLDALARGEDGVVVVAAPAGMGKTKLLEEAHAGAEPRGVRPLLARASELERDFAFGVVRQLLERLVGTAAPAERDELLAGAAAHAAAVFDLAPDAAPDREFHATLNALYWLLVNLSTSAPLLVAVDDLQWADEPSIRWLAYVARRLERLPIALIASARTDAEGRVELADDVSDEAAKAIDEIVARDRAERLEPGPLSTAAVAAVLESALRERCDDEFAAACRAQTGGNPFLLSELAAELTAAGVAPLRDEVGRLAGVVPERIGATVRRRLERGNREARALASAVAVLGEGGELPLAAELAGLDLGAAAAAAAELVRAQVLADSSDLRFRHPLIRAAVEGEFQALELATRHAEAARLLARRGAPHGRIAAHVMASPAGGGDARAVVQLRAAARDAQAQGVPEQSVALLRRALAEPPPAELRGAVARELGAAALAAFEPDAAEHLEAALAATDEHGARAELAISTGIAHVYAGRTARALEVLLAQIEEIRGHPELREGRLLMEAVAAKFGRIDLATRELVGDRLHDLAATLTGDTPAERLVLALAAGERYGPRADDYYRALALDERDVIGQRLLPDPGYATGTIVMYLLAHRPDAARTLCERVLADAAAEGSPRRYAHALAGRGAIALDLGDLASAETDLRRSIELLGDLSLGTNPPVVGFLVQTLAARGELETAEAALQAHGLAGDVPEQMFANNLLFGRGVLRAAQARWAEAEADFRELGRRHELWGTVRPTPPWRSECALVLLQAGDREGARRLAAEELRLATLWDTPRAVAAAKRAVALIEAGDDALAQLTAAVDLLENTPWRLDRTRTRCDLGAALRRAGRRREAREELTLAMDEAYSCGAAPLAELTVSELRASGARPRRRAISGVDALTPSERRVAELAAAGRSNRDIAQELFVTTATVETHLSRTYRKLGLSGRAGLSEALAGAHDAPLVP